jgi:hypothetical protein
MSDSVPPPPPGFQAGVEVTARFFFLAWILYFIKPTIEVDGTAYRRKWGTYAFDLAPGHHRVRVSFPYIYRKDMGANEIEFDLAPGQVRKVVYRAPYIVFMKGSIKET